MKHSAPGPFLTRLLLSFVRDHRPTVSECLVAFGEQGFHLLRKHGLLVIEGGRCRLSRRHLSPDGTRFVLGQRLIHLDDDVIELVRWGPEGPPVWNDEP